MSFQKLYRCVDPSELALQGDIGFAQGQHIEVELWQCNADSEVQCKSDEEIKKFFSDQNMSILSNQIRFDFEKYGSESIIQESSIESIILGDWQSRQFFEISRTQLALQDLVFNLDEVTELEDSSVFRLSKGDKMTNSYHIGLL